MVDTIKKQNVTTLTIVLYIVLIGFIGLICTYIIGVIFHLPLPFLKKRPDPLKTSTKRASMNVSVDMDNYDFTKNIRNSDWWKKTISPAYCPDTWTLTDPENYECKAMSTTNHPKNPHCPTSASFRGYPKSPPPSTPRDVNNGTYCHTKIGWADYCQVTWTNPTKEHPPDWYTLMKKYDTYQFNHDEDMLDQEDEILKEKYDNL